MFLGSDDLASRDEDSGVGSVVQSCSSFVLGLLFAALALSLARYMYICGVGEVLNQTRQYIDDAPMFTISCLPCSHSAQCYLPR